MASTKRDDQRDEDHPAELLEQPQERPARARVARRASRSSRRGGESASHVSDRGEQEHGEPPRRHQRRDQSGSARKMRRERRREHARCDDRHLRPERRPRRGAARRRPTSRRRRRRATNAATRRRGSAPAQYGGVWLHHSPSTLKAFQNAVFAGCSSSDSSMSGVTSPWIVGVSSWSSPSTSVSSRASGKRAALRKATRGLAHRDHELRLDDVQLAQEEGPRLLLVAARELEAVRAVDRHRVDVQALQRLQERVAGAAVEGDSLLQLRRLRRVLEEEDVRERMAGAEHGNARSARRLRKLVTESVALGDRLLQVLLVDLVVRHGHRVPRAKGSGSANPFLGLGHPLQSLQVDERLRAAAAPRRRGARRGTPPGR